MAGRKKHSPTPEQLKTVEAMSAYGVPQEDISKVIGIDPTTLRKYYADELLTAKHKANARVAEALFKKATGDGPQSTTAAIFWLKTRAQWKETSVHELGGTDGSPIQVVTGVPRADD